jgi:F-type H+-transporting ATPase subunit c
MKKFTIFAFSMLAVLFLFTPEVYAASSDGEAISGLALGAGLGIGLAAAGGAIGQGKTMDASLIAIGRNPGAAGQIQTPMIIGLALIESLVIYALAITFLLQSKI